MKQAAIGTRNLTTLCVACALLIAVAFAVAGCTDEPPDTSAPERIEIDRSADWRGALLYIADSGGPVEGWGSINVYDNVTGFVEMTIEQTFAASPSDVYVTPEGSRMYVSSMANGRVDIFHWDGNGWRRGTRDVATPSRSLLAMAPGPDGQLYLAGSTADGDSAALYRLDPETGQLDEQSIITIPALFEARGITWAAGGTSAFVTGNGPDGASLVQLSWPDASIIASTPLPVATVNQPLIAPDESVLYIACAGQVLVSDPVTGAITGSLRPAGDTGADFYDIAFSADGLFMFAPGTVPGSSSTLFVIELASGSVVEEVSRVSVKSNGIQRVK